DWVTTPVTRRGRIVFAVGCGILTVLIRVYGGYPEGVSYSILLMNLATPLIDRYTVPRQFGAQARKPAPVRGGTPAQGGAAQRPGAGAEPGPPAAGHGHHSASPGGR
ncbi:MAG: RnfABCDGE type electron transport complex subunit D, partial [Chloroflexi bacterium]|nr:RnfABCDGE type electron transport complex subunit D [Chloroflexota bacterium]